MIVFPHAKINLGLYVTSRRTDGYHNLETCFVPVDVRDALEILPARPHENTAFSSSGLPIPGTAGENLCLKAFRMLQQEYGLPEVHIHLHKVIPTGAGLGGGSSDAAFTLMLLDRLFHLNLSQESLTDFAARLGSDCAFFLHPGPCIGRGKGELLTPVSLSLAEHTMVVVKPPVPVSTAEAYRSILPVCPDQSIEAQLQQPMEEWKHILRNDFEQSVFQAHPEISLIKQRLYTLGAGYASMSGSGSAVFGLFGNDRAPSIECCREDFPECQIFLTQQKSG